jgi:hypothetical protein
MFIEQHPQESAAWKEKAAVVGMYDERLQGVQGALEDTTADTADLTAANELLAQKIAETTDRYSELKGELDAEEDFLNAELMWGDLQKSAEDAYIAAATGAEDAAALADAHRLKVIDVKQSVVELGEQYADLPEEEITRITALIDEGKLGEAEQALNTLARNRQMRLSISAAGGTGSLTMQLDSFAGGGVVPGALGQPRLAVVHGQEIITDPRNGNGNRPGGGNTYVLQSLVAPTEAQLQTFGHWIEAHERRQRGMR